MFIVETHLPTPIWKGRHVNLLEDKSRVFDAPVRCALPGGFPKCRRVHCQPSVGTGINNLSGSMPTFDHVTETCTFKTCLKKKKKHIYLMVKTEQRLSPYSMVKSWKTCYTGKTCHHATMYRNPSTRSLWMDDQKLLENENINPSNALLENNLAMAQIFLKFPDIPGRVPPAHRDARPTCQGDTAKDPAVPGWRLLPGTNNQKEM